MNDTSSQPTPKPEAEPDEIDITLDVNPGERIQIDIEIGTDGHPKVRQQTLAPRSNGNRRAATPPPKARPSGQTKRKLRAPSALTLFGLAMVVYLLTRLIAITEYPIYFFCDEAVNTVLASDLIRDNLHSTEHELLPTFFKNGVQYNLSVSVYLQVIPYLLFGKSILVTRGVSALLTLLAALWLAWMARDHFKLPNWWLAPLALAVIPTWFLHSRSAYENALLPTFYIGSLYYYLNYRSGKTNHLYPALILAALAFYSYTPGQVVVALTGLALLVLDFRYHLRHRGTALRGLGLLAALALPMARFLLTHPQDYATRLGRISPYWSVDNSILWKAGQYIGQYLSGFNPIFWFFPNQAGEAVHQMAGHAHIAMLLLPFCAWGLWIVAHHLRQPENRVTLLALLVAPSGAALVGLNANRALVIVIPAVLLALVGFAAAVEWLAGRIHLPQRALSAALFIALTFGSFGLLVNSLTKEPVRYTDYGLSGLQFGAKEVFPAARAYRAAHPDRQALISPNWTFQAEVMRQFFISNDNNIRMHGIDQTIQKIDPQIDQKVFVLLKKDLEQVTTSGHFDEPVVEQVIDYPDGSPGFYFVRLRYRDDIQAVLQGEKELRSQMVEDTAQIGDQMVTVRHMEMEGNWQNLFDLDPDSLAKTNGVNPLAIELLYDTASPLTGIVAKVGAESVRITVQVWVDETQPPQTFVLDAAEDGQPFKDVQVDFGQTLSTHRLRFELQDVQAGEDAIVHLWELTPIQAQ